MSEHLKMQVSKIWYTCSKCGKILSSYHSLWRHKSNSQSTTTQRKRHGRAVEARTSQPLVTVGQKRPISTFNREEFGSGKPVETGSRNPKIQALLHEIINDDQIMDIPSQPSFAVKQNSTPARRAIPQKSPKPSAEVIAEVFPSELPNPPSEIVAALYFKRGHHSK